VNLRRNALVVADRARRVWWRVRRPITVGVQVVVLDDAGRVLLVRNSYDPRRQWRLPGGGAKAHETMRQGALRELREETGIEVHDPSRAELLGVFANFKEGKSDHVGVFVVRPPDWTDGSADSAEISGRRFVPVDDLPPDTTPGTLRRVHEAVTGTPPPDQW
jgi:ADP-ribose pyrophosphatase YjhB (NUDIX family)